jgi:hypothetical protein
MVPGAFFGALSDWLGTVDSLQRQTFSFQATAKEKKHLVPPVENPRK